MFLEDISEFVEFLSSRERSLEEILAQITVRVLSPLSASTAFICELDKENLIQTLGVYGVDKGLADDYPDSYSFDEKLPIPDAIRNRKIIWISNLPNWPNAYPRLQSMPSVGNSKTFICFPIEKSGTPIGAFGVFCNSVVKPDREVEVFLKAIAHLLSLHLYRSNVNSEGANNLAKANKAEPVNNTRTNVITDRQLLILRMMSEGRTNIAISELLGYSESTIRQETIKIFAKLECSGREEASAIFREKLEK